MSRATINLSSHAKERLRQRHGIESVQVGVEWVRSLIEKADDTFTEGHKTHYVKGANEVVMDGDRVVTVKPTEEGNAYIKRIRGVVSKEIKRLLTEQQRVLHKAEIEVAQLTLNFLRAKNPKVKATIQSRLNVAIDEKERVLGEIRAVELSAEHYGVEV